MFAQLLFLMVNEIGLIAPICCMHNSTPGEYKYIANCVMGIRAKRLGVLTPLFAVCGAGEWVWVDSNDKNDTRHPVEIYFGREYAAICHHCGIMAAWSRQNRNIFETLLRFFWKTTPYDKIFKILFGKFTSRHRSTLLCEKFVKIVRREIGESVRYLPDRKQKHFFGSPANCGYCADRAQSPPWPAPNIWLTTFQISSKSVHFRRPREGRSKCTIETD